MASLIKVGGGKTPARAVQFVDWNGIRRTIRVGPIGLEAGREFKRRVERLLSCRITNETLDRTHATWLAGLPDVMHAKLSTVGLVAPREPEPTAPTLGEWLDKYTKQRAAELKPTSMSKLDRTIALLKEHFGTELRIDQLTHDGAADWRSELASTGIAEATIHTHCRYAKLIFKQAVKR